MRRTKLDSKISLISLGDVSKPINTLIEKIAEATGVLYEPTRITRKAKAEAKAQEIATLSELNIQGIQKRTLQRFLHEETKKQENIESIIEATVPNISINAKSELIEQDWIVRFFDNAKLISDKEMQIIWSRILAGETNNPGTFSKRTLSIISELDKQDAVMFTNICKFLFIIGDTSIVVFDYENEIYNKHGINFATLTQLDAAGLIHLNTVAGYVRKKLPKEFLVSYYGKTIKIIFPKDQDNVLPFGFVLLSKVGKQLTTICASTSENEILEYTIEKWKSKGLLIE